MRTIVFIDMNKSGSSRDALVAAEQLGFFTVVLTANERLVQKRTEYPDVHQMLLVNLTDKAVIRETLQSIEQQGKIIEAILSFVDPYVHLATELADERGINRFSTSAVQKMEDKVLTRKALQGTSYCPYYDIYDHRDSLTEFLQDQEDELPLIVKSPKSCGSKDVMLAKKPERLEYYVQKLRRKYPTEPVLVEEYLDGPQFLVEVMVHEQQVHIVAVLEQEIHQGPRFIVTGYALWAKVPATIRASLETAVSEIVNLLGMKTGTCHLEMRFVRNKWRVIEINPRISGGAMNRMIQAAYGINLVKETIKLALGETPDLQKQHERFVYTQYVTVPTGGYLEKVTGKQRALHHPGVQDVYIKPRKDTYLYPPMSMGHRYAYVLAAADSITEAKSIAKTAAEEIEFHLR